MKFRLDAQHAMFDRLLEPGTVIGDEETGFPMVHSNGEPMKPSVYMTPLDDEARDLFKETFPGARMPERDPTKAIPLRGTGDVAKSPPVITTPAPVEPAATKPATPVAPPAEKK